MDEHQRAEAAARATTPAAITCVVWDLDNTLWDGVLLEDPQVTLRPAVVEVIHTLNRRGILNSIADRKCPTEQRRVALRADRAEERIQIKMQDRPSHG